MSEKERHPFGWRFCASRIMSFSPAPRLCAGAEGGSLYAGAERGTRKNPPFRVRTSGSFPLAFEGVGDCFADPAFALKPTVWMLSP